MFVDLLQVIHLLTVVKMCINQSASGLYFFIPSRAVGDTTAATAMVVPVFESHTKYYSSELTNW